MSDLTSALAEFVADSGALPRSTDADAAAVRLVLDTIGVLAAGRYSPAGGAILRWARCADTDGALLWSGAPAACAPPTLALVQATLAHALDYDDALPGAGHPSAILLSCLLSRPTLPLDGRRLIDAFIIGYEVNARVARAVGHRHYLHGWHTTSTVGVFGAVAAICALERSDAKTVRRAFGIAASMAAGLQRNFGTMTKPLHSGFAAQHGLLAAQLATEGLTAEEAILDGERGFLDVYSRGAMREDALCDLGTRWAITSPGPTIKLYPCALETYRALEGVLTLLAEHELTADRVAAVHLRLPPGTLGPLRHRVPTDGSQAKFSMHYAVAVAMIDREVGLAAFTDGTVARKDLRAAIDIVHPVEDVACRPDDPSGAHSSASAGGFVEITIETRDATAFTRTIRDPIGSPTHPLSDGQLQEKFLACLAYAGHGPRVGGTLLTDLWRLPQVAEVHAALRTLGQATGPRT